MEIKDFHHEIWGKCVRIACAGFELAAALAFGPRILHFSRPGGENVFAELPEDRQPTLYGPWCIRGGHRLWAAPEQFPQTYHPDNEPVEFAALPGGLRLTGAAEAGTGLQKIIEVVPDQSGRSVHIRHRIRRKGPGSLTVAPWALSVMAPGGTAVLPLRPAGAAPDGLKSSHGVSLWPYSDPADPRWTWTTDYLLLRQDPAIKTPQKVGVTGQDGWAAYVQAGQAFLKSYTYEAGASYPDGNVSLEVYLNERFLEVETLGPLRLLAEGEETTWQETWQIITRGDLELSGSESHRMLDIVSTLMYNPLAH